MGLSEEHVARNDARFRDANERIFRSAVEYGVTDAIPFLCECRDPACTAIIRLSAEEYGRIRADSRRFLNARGHAEPVLNALEIVERHPTYDVIAKVGRAAEIAEGLNPPPRA
ncbi:MAG TPA: hypothetical protein VE736_06295 [Gaiellaceae bacterium]|jgi:hypothetical protein|nr:hypothetical protein [Gaiellaceae bacterium]